MANKRKILEAARMKDKIADQFCGIVPTKIFEVAKTMLKNETNGTKFRLLGVGVANIQSDQTADQDDLINQDNQRIVALEKAIDEVNQKFGNKIESGITFAGTKK